MSVPLIITGLPAAGKSYTRTRLGGRGIDCSVLADEAMRDPETWERMRRRARALLRQPDDAFWSAPGLEALCVEWTPVDAAAFERQTAALLLPRLAARMQERVLIEATPLIALELVVRFPVQVLMIETNESERRARLAERLGPRREHADDVAAFHRMMYQPATYAMVRSTRRIESWDGWN